MKEKLGRQSILGVLIILWFANFYFGLKLNYPPYENELTTLINSKLVIPKAQLSYKDQQTILNNVLGPDQYLTEKLFPLRSWLQVLSGTESVLNLRVFNFFLLTASLIFFYFFLKEVGWKSRIALISLIPIVISPLFLSLWLFRPKICLSVFFIILWLYLLARKVTDWSSVSFLIISPLLSSSSSQGLMVGLLILTPLTVIRLYRAKKHLVLSILIFLILLVAIPKIKNPIFRHRLTQTPLLSAVDPNQIEKEINERVIKEDSLQTRIIFPLWSRRLGYNKIFFAYRNVAREIVGFFDLETLFFQEVHPAHQKSEVIFFWPEIFLFLIGLIQLMKGPAGTKQKSLLILILFSIFFYLFTVDDSPAGRHIFTLFALAMLIGEGLKAIPKRLSLIIIPLLVWAVYINAYDIRKRPLFWYDNRPYIYSEGITTIKKLEPNLTPSTDIYLTTLVGNPKIYFLYYFYSNPHIFLQSPSTIERNGKTIHFNSFDLQTNPPQRKSLYLGFLGEFIGTRILNDFSEQDINQIKKLGLKIEKVWKLDNTIAFRYGDYFILATSQNQEEP